MGVRKAKGSVQAWIFSGLNCRVYNCYDHSSLHIFLRCSNIESNAMNGQHCENFDVKWEIAHWYPRKVNRCWSERAVQSGLILARLSKFAFVLLCCITNHLVTGPLGKSEFCFPRTSIWLGKHWDSWETKCTGPVMKCISFIYHHLSLHPFMLVQILLNGQLQLFLFDHMIVGLFICKVCNTRLRPLYVLYDIDFTCAKQ